MTKRFRLEGRVLDESQTPVSGAQVRLMPTKRSVTTDADGAFAFDDLTSARYRVSAKKDDYFAWPLLVGPEDTAEPLSLQLCRGATLIVHVSGDQAPVRGATVILDDGTTSDTDANGVATVRALAPGTRMGSLVADGWAQEPIAFSLQEDPGGVVQRFVTLQRGARIEGTVRGALGRPVSGAKLLLWKQSGGGPPYETTSTVDGSWRIVVPAGKYRLVGHTRKHGRIGAIAIVSDGTTAVRDVVVRVPAARAVGALVRSGKRLLMGSDAARVAGVVVDKAGEPASGVEIRLVDSSAGRWVGRSDARGRFEVDGLESPWYEAIVEWPGPSSRPRSERTRQRVETGDTNVKLVVTSGATVTGRVLVDGNALPYYGLRLLKPRMSPYGSPVTAVRSEDGRFTLRDIDPGTWRIAVMGPGTRVVTSNEFTIARNEPVDVGDIPIERGYRVAGHVRDRTGAPVAGARVVIGRMSEFTDGRSNLEKWFMGQYETTSDAEGVYAFEGIDVNREHMRIPEIVWAVHPKAGASVIQELPKTEATLDFTLLEVGRIEGILEGSPGGHAAALAVRADEPPFSRRSQVDKEGRFQFADLPPGNYVVQLNTPDGEPGAAADVTVVAHQTARAKLVASGSSVRITVRVPPGRGKDLVIEPASDGAAIRGRVRGCMGTGTEDRCSLEYVQPGTYRVSLDGTKWVPITVKASPAEQTIDLR